VSKRSVLPFKYLALGCAIGAASACHSGPFSLGVGPEPESTSDGGSVGSGVGGGGALGQGAGTAVAATGGSERTAGGSGGTSAETSGGASGAVSAGGSGGSSPTDDFGPAVGALSWVSMAPDGTPGSGDASDPSLSADGRFVSFSSYSENLVSGDTNFVLDVFVRDRSNRATTRVSVSEIGAELDFASGGPALSQDGRWIAYSYIGSSTSILRIAGPLDDPDPFTPIVEVPASNGVGPLPSLSGAGELAVYLLGRNEGGAAVAGFRRIGGVTERLSDCGGMNIDVLGAPRVSADGTRVAFGGLVGTVESVFMFDGQSGGCRMLSVAPDGSPGNARSYRPSISGDGRFVAFTSEASNLVVGDDNGVADVFVRDLATQTTRRIDPEPSAPGPSDFAALSGDGRYLVFASTISSVQADNTRRFALYERNLETNRTVKILEQADFGVVPPFYKTLLNQDGRVVVFESYASLIVDDTRAGSGDIYVFEFSAQP
jgi:TolB protein